MNRTVRRAAVTLAALLLTGCAGPPAPPSITVGAAPGDEAELVAQLYAAALRYYGTAARVEPAADPLTGLDAGTVSVVPGFTGELLRTFEPDATARAAVQVYRQMVSALPEGVAAGDYTTSAEDKPAAVVTSVTADRWGGAEVSGLAGHCSGVRMGAVTGTQVPPVVGTCRLPKAREFADDAALFTALRAGLIDAAWTSTAAPDIPSDLVLLADRTSLIRAENLVPLYRRNELSEQQVLAINEIAGVLDTAALAAMRAQVAAGNSPQRVADEWLAANPLGH